MNDVLSKFCDILSSNDTTYGILCNSFVGLRFFVQKRYKPTGGDNAGTFNTTGRTSLGK